MISPSFLHVNLPYGIRKNADGEWYAFNRMYLPLGIKDRAALRLDNKVLPQDEYDRLFIGTPYAGLTETLLTKLAVNRIERDKDNSIICIWLYNGEPLSNTTLLNEYFDKLKTLSKLKIGTSRKRKS